MLQLSKFFGVILNLKSANSEDLISKIYKARQVIGCISSLWWDKNISLETKNVVRKSYGSISGLLGI